jgi:hypothetical protein
MLKLHGAIVFKSEFFFWTSLLWSVMMGVVVV